MRNLSYPTHGGPRVLPGNGCRGMVTSRRVGCGCTVRSFTAFGECGLSLSLGLRLVKTHSLDQEM